MGSANPSSINIQESLRILELEPTADIDVVRRAYRRQVKRWHPDQFAQQPAIQAQAEERLKRINQAYRNLRNRLESQQASRPHDKAHSAAQKETQDQAKSAGPQPPPRGESWFSAWRKRMYQGKKEDGLNRRSGKKRAPSAADHRPKDSFERILRQAADPCPTDSPIKSGAVRSPRPYTAGRRRKKGMRIEGYAGAAPFAPVKPVSRIRRIESSD